MRFSIIVEIAVFLILVSLLGVVPARAQTRWQSGAEQNQLSPGSASSAPSCQTETPTLTNRSIGPVYLGQQLRGLEAICATLIYGWDRSASKPAPAVLVRFGEVGLLIDLSGTAETSNVSRITSGDAQLRTSDGFGPGSSLFPMIKSWGTPKFSAVDCKLYIRFATRQGLSFRVELPDHWDCPASSRVSQTGDIGLLPRSSRVGEAVLSQEK